VSRRWARRYTAGQTAPPGPACCANGARPWPSGRARGVENELERVGIDFGERGVEAAPVFDQRGEIGVRSAGRT